MASFDLLVFEGISSIQGNTGLYWRTAQLQGLFLIGAGRLEVGNPAKGRRAFTSHVWLCVPQLSRLTDFQPASIEDLCKIHERNYVLGLEKIVRRGRNDVVDNAPTYITPTSFDDALRVGS